jgi:hypothetical protein
MDEFPFFGTVDFSVSIPAAPWEDLDYYVHKITGTIKCAIDDYDEVTVGRIVVLKVAAVEAMNQGVPLVEICDAHSSFLEAAYWAIFERKGEAKSELEIEPCFNDILVLWEYEIDARFRHTDAVARAFNTAISAFGPQALVIAAMARDKHRFIGLDLTVDEWRYLGFQRIASSQFVFRDGCCLNPYRDSLASD